MGKILGPNKVVLILRWSLSEVPLYITIVKVTYSRISSYSKKLSEMSVSLVLDDQEVGNPISFPYKLEWLAEGPASTAKTKAENKIWINHANYFCFCVK